MIIQNVFPAEHNIVTGVIIMELFKNRRIRKYLQAVDVFVALTFSPEPPAEKIKYSSRDVQYSLPKATDTPKDDVRSQNIKYSFSPEETDTQESPKRSPYSIYGSDIGLIDPPTTDNEIPNHGDSFKAASVSSFLSQNTNSPNLSRLASKLDNYLDLTFVDMLTRYINEKGWRDSRVYKAAQLDRRLFSKIMSDRNYKPSKDRQRELEPQQVFRGLHFPIRQKNP